MHPTIRILWRNRFAAILCVLQMTLALAVVLNALTIFDARIARAFRPTGIDESDLVTVKQSWVTVTDENGRVDTTPFIPRQVADIAALRSIPGVSDVSVVNSLPLAGWSRNGRLSQSPSDMHPKVDAALYYTDDSLAGTLHLRFAAGRNFSHNEVRDAKQNDALRAGPIIITSALANSLFHGLDALGRVVYVNGSAEPSTVIGVVDRLQTPARGAWGTPFAFNSVIIPSRISSDTTYFVIRSRPNELRQVKSKIASTLYGVSSNRVIENDAVRTFSEIRSEAYRSDIAMAWMMIIVSSIFVAITASGVVGLTSFWVRKRQRTIGVRRALGATRRDIALQYLSENAAMAILGALLGGAAAIVLNRSLMANFEVVRLSAVPTFVGMLSLVLISLTSAFVPSLRAANVAPVEAIRSV